MQIEGITATSITGDLKMRFCNCFEETAYMEFDKHTALAVAEQLYKYYKSQQNKEEIWTKKKQKNS